MFDFTKDLNLIFTFKEENLENSLVNFKKGSTSGCRITEIFGVNDLKKFITSGVVTLKQEEHKHLILLAEAQETYSCLIYTFIARYEKPTDELSTLFLGRELLASFNGKCEPEGDIVVLVISKQK